MLVQSTPDSAVPCDSPRFNLSHTSSENQASMRCTQTTLSDNPVSLGWSMSAIGGM